MKRKLGFRTSILLLILVFFSGCERETTTYSQGGGLLPTNYIVIQDNGFSPSSLTLASGNSITFLNNTGSIHQIVSDDSMTINTGNIVPQRSYYWKKDIAGTINFHCVQHPNDRGILILTP